MPSYRPIHPDAIAAPYDIRVLEHRQIGKMAVQSRPASTLYYEVVLGTL